MVFNKRKKDTRQRGSKTHGWGSMKKHRGAGHRGGRGAAGSGKRGDAKKPSIWQSFPKKGKQGFSSKSRNVVVPITLAYLEKFSKTLEKEGYVKTDGKTTTINLEKAGYTKLLATGNVTKAWNITIANATPNAIEKVKKAKGSVTLTSDEKNVAEEVKTEE